MVSPCIGPFKYARASLTVSKYRAHCRSLVRTSQHVSKSPANSPGGIELVCVAVALESVAINPIASLVVSNTMTGLRYGTKITINLHSLYTDMVVLVLEHIPSSLNNTKITTDVRNLSEQGQIAHPFTERTTRLRYRSHVRFTVTRRGGRR